MIMQLQRIEQVFCDPSAGKIYNLLQFRKALREEAYENCPYWIEQALQSGAKKSEIAFVIRNPSRHLEEPLRLS